MNARAREIKLPVIRASLINVFLFSLFFFLSYRRCKTASIRQNREALRADCIVGHLNVAAASVHGSHVSGTPPCTFTIISSTRKRENELEREVRSCKTHASSIARSRITSMHACLPAYPTFLLLFHFPRVNRTPFSSSAFYTSPRRKINGFAYLRTPTLGSTFLCSS